MTLSKIRNNTFLPLSNLLLTLKIAALASIDFHVTTRRCLLMTNCGNHHYRVHQYFSTKYIPRLMNLCDSVLKAINSLSSRVAQLFNIQEPQGDFVRLNETAASWFAFQLLNRMCLNWEKDKAGEYPSDVKPFFEDEYKLAFNLKTDLGRSSLLIAILAHGLTTKCCCDACLEILDGIDTADKDLLFQGVSIVMDKNEKGKYLRLMNFLKTGIDRKSAFVKDLHTEDEFSDQSFSQGPVSIPIQRVKFTSPPIDIRDPEGYYEYCLRKARTDISEEQFREIERLKTAIKELSDERRHMEWIHNNEMENMRMSKNNLEAYLRQVVRDNYKLDEENQNLCRKVDDLKHQLDELTKHLKKTDEQITRIDLDNLLASVIIEADNIDLNDYSYLARRYPGDFKDPIIRNLIFVHKQQQMKKRQTVHRKAVETNAQKFQLKQIDVDIASSINDLRIGLQSAVSDRNVDANLKEKFLIVLSNIDSLMEIVQIEKQRGENASRREMELIEEKEILENQVRYLNKRVHPRGNKCYGPAVNAKSQIMERGKNIEGHVKPSVEPNCNGEKCKNSHENHRNNYDNKKSEIVKPKPRKIYDARSRNYYFHIQRIVKNNERLNILADQMDRRQMRYLARQEAKIKDDKIEDDKKGESPK